MAHTETLTSITPQIAGLETQQVQSPYFRVRLKNPSGEDLRQLDEVIEVTGIRVSYVPKDDVYIIPSAFPIDVLEALHGIILDSQEFTK